jgi:hypothetical protein
MDLSIKRSMNVMNYYIYIYIIYIYIYIYICIYMCEGGCAEKETTMAEERWWKAPGMVALTSTEPIPYLVFTGPENQERLTGPEMNYSPGW